MDPALLKARDAFKKRAMATPSFGRNVTAPAQKTYKQDANNYKRMTASSLNRFNVLAKIVRHMRAKHHVGDDHSLALEEILEETNLLHIETSMKTWLANEALINNPKIKVSSDMRYSFKPVYKIKDGKGLIRLLKQHDLKGLGGILLADVEESLPNCENILKKRASEITCITRSSDKKKVLFYNDHSADFTVDEEFRSLWRATTVDAMDDRKIDEYLEQQGMSSMQDLGKKVPVPKRTKAPKKKRQLTKPRDNEHLVGVLETYEDNTLALKGANPTQ